MTGDDGDPSAALNEFLGPGERLLWYETTEATVSMAVVAIGVVFSGVLIFGSLWLLVPTFDTVAAGGLYVVATLVVVGPLLFVFYRLLAVRYGGREYAITDERVVKSGGLVRTSFDARRWDEVASVEFDPTNYQRLRFPRRQSAGVLGRLRDLVERDLVFRRVPDGHDAYGPALEAFVDANGEPGATARTDPLTADRSAVDEEIHSVLNPDERIEMQVAVPHKTRLRTYVLYASVGTLGMPLLAWIVIAPAVIFTPLSLTVLEAATLACLVGAVGATWLVWRVVRQTASRAYAATDQRVIGRDEYTSGWISVTWDDIATLQRRGDHIFVYETDPREQRAHEYGTYGPHIKRPALAFRDVPDGQAVFGTLRQLRTEYTPDSSEPDRTRYARDSRNETGLYRST